MAGGNFIFNNGVPAANDDPSVDQPIMLNNNVAISNWVDQDHEGFNTTDNSGGTHLQITFSSNNVPVSYTLPVLYTNNDAASHPQLFMATTSAANSTNQYTAGSNGSVLLFGGMILKWFRGNITGANTTFSFNGTIPGTNLNIDDFPNNAYAAVVTAEVTNVQASYTNLLKTGVTITRDTSSGTTAVTVFVIGN